MSEAVEKNISECNLPFTVPQHSLESLEAQGSITAACSRRKWCRPASWLRCFADWLSRLISLALSASDLFALCLAGSEAARPHSSRPVGGVVRPGVGPQILLESSDERHSVRAAARWPSTSAVGARQLREATFFAGLPQDCLLLTHCGNLPGPLQRIRQRVTFRWDCAGGERQWPAPCVACVAVAV